MDFRIGRTVVSPSSSASSGLLYPPAAPHSLTPTPIFYYPGLPLKIPPSPHSSPLVPPSGLNGNHHRPVSGSSSSSLMMRSTATVQPSALHPPVPQSSPHLHRTAPGSSAVVSPPSTGTSARHQLNGGSSNNSNSSSSSSNSSSSSFAAALRHLAKQAGGPTQSTIHSDPEVETSPNRSSYPGGTHGYPHAYNGDRVSKSPSPSAHYRSTSKRDSGHTKSRREDGLHTTVTTRSRSPPVVTIAPTLSLSGLHYQDSRKVYDRAMLCHSVPSSGGFSGGLSTGLTGLQGIPSMVGNASSYTAPSMMANSSSPASSNGEYARPSDMSGFSHPMPSYTPFPSSRPDDLFYGGLRSSMQQSVSAATTSHFRPEENRNVPMGINNSYHESLLSQLPSSRPASTLLSQHQEDYLLATRNSGFNPYALASSGLDHSSLHPSMYSHPYASYRSLEEQMYLERYGLLRPGSSTSALPSAIPPYPPLGFPSYLNFRYPSPGLLHSDIGLVNNGMELNRMKLEQEQRIKERIREEEFAAAAASKTQENVVSNRPLATVTPRENSSTNQDRRERERQREKRKSEKDHESNRKITVQLPNESSSGRGVKVHTVSPLYASYPVMVDRCNSITEETAAPEASISPNPPTEEEKRTTEFSLGALEAMAVLKKRTVSSPLPEEEPSKQEEEVTVPLDLSDRSVESISPPDVSHQLEICRGTSHVEESPVRSLLDVRVERWKRKRQNSDPEEEENDDDLDDEMGQESSESLESLSVEQCLKKYPIPAGVSEEQHHFLHMFGLITPKKRSEFELVKCIRRQNILREPTPQPIDAEDEDSATSLLKQRTRFAATLIRSGIEPHIKDPAIKNFASSLNLYPADTETVESIEKSWNLVVADRMKRHFGQKQNVRKRLWSDTFRPFNFDSTPPSTNGVVADEPINQYIEGTGQLLGNSDSNHVLTLLSPTAPLNKPLSKASDSVVNLTKFELTISDSKSTVLSSEASKLTSEVAFWLRHLKPTMARTLNSSSIKENASDPTKSDEGSSAENSDGEVPSRWPGIDAIMVLYMAHQQELLVETKFLREHCERLHIQLAEGQATLSKLCLALSSSVEVQRRCKEEDTSTLQSISDLQTTLKLLQSP